MPITPTTLIAVSGLVRGSGLQIPTELTSAISSIQNNPLVSSISSLSTGGFNIPASLTSLTQLNSTAGGILTQAQSILPAGGAGGDPSSGIKSFMSVFNGSTAFGSASAEYSAALSQFGNKSFADLGINVSNFQDVITNGTSSITRSLQAVANKAATDAFGSVASVLDPNLLAKGQAAMKSSVLADGLQSVGSGLKNFGTLFDFTQPSGLGPKNLIANLQKQGLADRNGINDLIYEAGYDPKNLAQVPDSVLTSVLDQVKGSDLDKIIRQTGANPYKSVRSAAGLLQANNLLPPQAALALGIIDKGPAALKALGNTLSNLGTSIDNFKMSDFMASMETKALQYLGQIKQLIPTDVKTALAPILGSGSGLFGNPQMKDMIGAASGIGYTPNLKTAGTNVTRLQNTAEGAALTAASTAYQSAIAGLTPEEIAAALADPMSPVAAAAAGVNAALVAFQPGNVSSTIQGIVTNISNVAAASAANLAKEVQNLALAGLKMVDNLGKAIEQTVNNSYQSILAFGNRLHKMGRDIQNLGFNDFLPKMATSNVAGDALQATLIEGRNVARSSAVGQSTPIIADEKTEIATASSSTLLTTKNEFIAADAEYKRTREAYYVAREKPNTPEFNAAAQNFYQAQIDRADARGKLHVEAQNANVSWGSLGVYESVRNNG
jgi:hypothetical protein